VTQAERQCRWLAGWKEDMPSGPIHLQPCHNRCGCSACGCSGCHQPRGKEAVQRKGAGSYSIWVRRVRCSVMG
jgi:hypothetical protein